MELGETLESALIREVEEEVLTTPQKIEFLGTREVFRGEGEDKTHWIGFDYRVKVDPKQVGIGEPEMCELHKWVSIDESPEPKQTQMDFKIQKYKDKL